MPCKPSMTTEEIWTDISPLISTYALAKELIRRSDVAVIALKREKIVGQDPEPYTLLVTQNKKVTKDDLLEVIDLAGASIDEGIE